MTLIASIDGPNRDIYLHADTVGATVNPIDIYKEMRALRKADETLRKYDVFLRAFGNVAKGGGKFTERYVRQESGTRFIPFDTTHQLTINGTVITDDGQEGIACFDRTPLTITTVVDINYVPPQVEIITVNSGSGVSAQDVIDIKDAVWAATTRTLTSAGAGGATAQEVWEYATRDLTASAGVTAQNITDIVDGVWDESNVAHVTADTYGKLLSDTHAFAAANWTTLTLNADGVDLAADIAALPTASIITDAVWDELVADHAGVGSTGEKIAATSVVDNDAIAAAVWADVSRTLTSASGPDAATIATAVWANVTRSLTVAAGVTGQDIIDISTAVWSETVRALTVQTGLTTTQNAQLMAIDINPNGLTVLENSQLMAIDTAANGLTIAENSQLMALPLNPVLDSDIRLDRGMTVAQEAKLDALPTAGAISAAVWSETVRDLTIAAGLTPSQEVQLLELWQLQGLDVNNPMTVTQTTRIAAAISILFTGDGVNSTTTTRQP